MPITFTEDDFTDEQKPQFTESDFAETPNIKLSPYEQAQIPAVPGGPRPETGEGLTTDFTQSLALPIYRGAIAGEQGLEKIQQGAEYLGGATIDAAKLYAQGLKTALTGETPPAPTRRPLGEPLIPPPPESEQGVIPAAGRLLSGFSTPGNILMAGLAPESKLAQAYFGTTAAAQIPESLQGVVQGPTWAARRGALTDLAFQSLIAGLTGRGAINAKPLGAPNAIYTEAAPSVRNVRPFPIEIQRQVPTEESGRTASARGREGTTQASQAEQARLLLIQKAQQTLDHAKSTGNEGLIDIAQENLKKVQDQHEEARVREQQQLEEQLHPFARQELIRQRREQEIKDLEADPEATGRKFVRMGPEGPEFEENAILKEKANRLEQLKSEREGRESGYSDEDYARDLKDLQDQTRGWTGKDATVFNDPSELAPGEEPFAAGEWARPSADGGMNVLGWYLRGRLAEAGSAAKRQSIIKALVSEEGIHRYVPDQVATQYFNNLSKLEQRIIHRTYTGYWTPEAYIAAKGPRARVYDARLLGHEAIRQQLQQLMIDTTSENVNAALKNRIQIGAYDMLARVVRAAREKYSRTRFGTPELRAKLAKNIKTLDDLGKKINDVRNGLEKAQATQGPGRPASLAEADTSDTTKGFVERFMRADLPRGNAHTTEAGMGARSIADLDAFLELNRQVEQQLADFKQKLADPKLTPPQRMALLNQYGLAGGRAQFPREAVEVATKTGSWATSMRDKALEGKERPLDWSKNPEIADWLRKNAAQLRLELPEELRAAPPAALGPFEKQREKEERKLAVTRAGSALDKRMLEHFRTLPTTQLENMLKQREAFLRIRAGLKEPRSRDFENQIKLLRQEIDRRGEQAGPAARFDQMSDDDLWRRATDRGVPTPVLSDLQLKALRDSLGFEQTHIDEDGTRVMATVGAFGYRVTVIPPDWQHGDPIGMAETFHNFDTGKGDLQIVTIRKGMKIDKDASLRAARELINFYNNNLPEPPEPPGYRERSFPAALGGGEGELPEQQKPKEGELFPRAVGPPVPPQQPELPTGAEQQPFGVPNAKVIEDTASQHMQQALTTGEPPDFDKYLGELQGKYGGGMTREKAFYPWMDSVTKQLLTAPGENIRKLLGKMGLVPDVAQALKPNEARPFLGSIPDAGSAESIEKTVRQTAMWPQQEPIARRPRQRLSKTEQAAQQRRTAAIGAILDHLSTEAGGKPKGVTFKKTIGPEDIDTSYVVLEPGEELMEGEQPTGEFKQAVVQTNRLIHQFTPEEAADPKAIGDIVTSGARRAPTDKRSLSRGLIALRDKINDRVLLLGAYEHQRRGPVVTNPEGAGPDVRIDQRLLDRYEPISAMRMREPLEGFRQVFKNSDEFARWFGGEGIEGTPGIKTSMFAGPQAGVAEETAGISRPSPYPTGRPTEEVALPAGPAPVTGRELTVPRFARKEVPAEPQPPVEGGPRPEPSRMLSEADQRALEARIKETADYAMTEFKPSPELEKRGISIMPGARGERVPSEATGLRRFRKPEKAPPAALGRQETFYDFTKAYDDELQRVFHAMRVIPNFDRAQQLLKDLDSGNLDMSKLSLIEQGAMLQAQKHWNNLESLWAANPEWTKLHTETQSRTEGMPPYGPGTGPASLAQGGPPTPQEELDYYRGRLRNPELLDDSVWVPFRQRRILAVPVGGSRKSGNIGIIELMSKGEANTIADTLRNKKGFPDVRVVQGPEMYGEKPANTFIVEWGKPIDWKTGLNPPKPLEGIEKFFAEELGYEPRGLRGEPTQEYHDRLGQQFGYKSGYGVEYPQDTAPMPMPGEAYPQMGLFGNDYPASIAQDLREGVERAKDRALENFRIGALEDQMAREQDELGNRKNNDANVQEFDVRLASMNRPPLKERLKFWQQPWTMGNRQVLAAANAVVESGFDRSRLQDFRDKLDIAEQNAQIMAQSGSARARNNAKAYMRDIEASRAEIDYADKHWNDRNLQNTAKRAKRILDSQVKFEMANGINVRRQIGYVPHRLVDIWGEDTLFSLPGVLGTKFQAPRSFRTHYDALAAGPYMRITHDIASLVHHRVRQGLGKVYRDQWKASLFDVQMPDGMPLAMKPLHVGEKIMSPHNNYELVPTENYGFLAIHKGASDMMRNLLAPSWVESSPKVRRLLHLEQKLKHSLLIGDFFHYARMVYYGASIIGRQALRAPWDIGKYGWSALDIDPRNVDEAVRKGVITQREADWAAEPVMGTGLSRRELVQKAYRQHGANIGRITDALYKDLLTDLTPTAGKARRAFVRIMDPSVGRYNRFLFDKMTRGLMAESIVHEFERQYKTGMDPDAVLRDISRDVNERFGNLGRQGIMKSKTAQDLSRLFFLAPQWVEGMARTELRATGRLTGAARLMGQRKGLDPLGTAGYAMARGLTSMFILTQGLNLITRGKPTWKNEEQGHWMDAWIPSMKFEHGIPTIDKEGDGFWLSPLSLFMELTHDLYRLGEARNQRGEELFGTLSQILSNKLSPVSRALMVMGSGTTPTGQRITSSVQRGLVQPALAAAPFPPITFSKYGRLAGHAIAPGVIQEVPKGQIQRQAISTLGVKVEPASSKPAQIGRLADQFMKREGLKKESGWAQVQTDEASYTKLRSAIRDHDWSHARDLYKDLLKSRTEEQVNTGMALAYKRPFTGSSEAEGEFIRSLSDEQLQMYQDARERQMDDYEAFANWVAQQP